MNVKAHSDGTYSLRVSANELDDIYFALVAKHSELAKTNNSERVAEHRDKYRELVKATEEVWS